MSTDLERFLATDGRADAIQRVRADIDAKGITYIYYQFASVTGRIMGKGVPADHWETIAQRGFQLVYGSTANLFTDRHGNYIGYGPEAWELVGLPDVETFCQLPWDPKTARVPYCYHIDQFAELQPLIHKVMEYGKAMGLDMIQGDHEDAPGQLELNWMFDRAEATADRLTTYRQICKQVGRELGAYPCFMPKPFMGVSANGCHHNISLWQGGENMFMPDTDNPRMPSKLGLNAIGGVLEHLAALTCITAPTVNSYRRFWDTGFWAPLFADWGFQNRTTALRVSAPGRFEYRSVDSAVNPYLSFAAIIKAMADGISRNLDPGPPEDRNIYDAIAGGKNVKRVPMNLGAALEALEADQVIREALPGEMYRVFHHYKTDEWERFCASVSDWDIAEYLDVLP